MAQGVVRLTVSAADGSIFLVTAVSVLPLRFVSFVSLVSLVSVDAA